MPQYKLKPSVIKAIRLAYPVTITKESGNISGNRGDWLITKADNSALIMTDVLFREKYEPVDQTSETYNGWSDTAPPTPPAE